MGGPGSGSWYRWDSKSTVGEYRRLGMRHLAPAINRVARGEMERELVPIGWWRGSEQVASILVFVEKLHGRPVLRLSYSITSRGETVDRDYHVPLSSTPSNLPGNPGRRWWFVCSLSVNGRYCGRRVAYLYGGSWFGCRHCHSLVYQSTRESHTVERLARYLAPELGGGGIPLEDITDYLRSVDRETLDMMSLTSQITRQTKQVERLVRKMGL